MKRMYLVFGLLFFVVAGLSGCSNSSNKYNSVLLHSVKYYEKHHNLAGEMANHCLKIASHIYSLSKRKEFMETNLGKDCRNVYTASQIGYEASNNLGAIFTDETAFNATDSTYISAGYYSTKGLNLSGNTQLHTFYNGNKAPTVAQYPYKCVNNVLESKTGKVTAGFPNLGFMPKGKLYFYYFVITSPKASTAPPAKLSAPTSLSSQPYVSCGNGYEAFAVINIGGNIQVYAVNDYSSNPILVYGNS